ncbi:MAG: ATP-binding cassette domain-containing protein [Erysipelotrichia bacterium]|nr:ATP-binding cassette domain-containing protein [Erysipelotrichia bacterium]
MKKYIVETVGLTKKFKHQIAVNDVNMKVEKGAIYGFIGRNGAGKTTTLKMICGLSTQTSGEIHLFNDTHKEFVYKSIGALIENTGAYPDMSAKENMMLKAIGLGINDKRQVNELLELLNLHHTDRKKVKHFSVGMKQRLGIALALLGNPDLLILDELTNGLDPEGIREIRNTILKLNEEKGITFIISSHILGELDKMATHYGIIKDGELIEQISRNELKKKCKSYLALVVDDVKKAIVILEEQLKVTDYELMENEEIHIYTSIDSKNVNEELLKKGIHISQIYFQKQDMETYFLEKMGGNQNA